MADSIKLKNGTILEGKILEETPDSIKIEYNLTKSIKDIKTIKRSDAVEISKEAEDEKALKYFPVAVDCTIILQLLS